MSLLTWISKKLTDCILPWIQSVSFLPHSTNSLSASSIFFIIVLCLSGCCTKVQHPNTQATYSVQPHTTEIPSMRVPAFLVKADNKPHNKIGTPKATEKNSSTQVQVSSTTPTMYFEQNQFSTEKANYTNLVYRIHFSKVPFGLCNINLTTGNNPGLLIIYTLDDREKLLLITTVHTCGCYLAFFPTTDLPLEAYPTYWPQETQAVFGYPLPSVVEIRRNSAAPPFLFTLESGTHRISNISQQRSHNLKATSPTPINLQPMDSLYQLPYKDKSISFFENSGRREGYVKNNSKILERLLISWWAFDWRVGEDKAYGKSDSSKTPFYTSLKFWQRNNSDMKNFAGFLSYWGWNL